jgi:hypothetical protein
MRRRRLRRLVIHTPLMTPRLSDGRPIRQAATVYPEHKKVMLKLRGLKVGRRSIVLTVDEAMLLSEMLEASCGWLGEEIREVKVMAA